MADLKARLDLAPADAVRYFAAKGEQLAWDYTEVWRDANSHAFTVAKVTDLELLRMIRAEVAKAIGDGQTFDEFKRTLRPRMQELGWWGRQETLDADTGELTTVQLGSVRRLRTIYQTNVQTAYMAGRYKRYLDNVADRPYWRYVAVMDGRTRPDHAALHDKVWRWDDPVWAVIWPPNGWGCRCRVVAMTQSEFERSGLRLESGADAITHLQVPIGKTGETVSVQGVRYVDQQGRNKVFVPDPGWDYNPGAAWARFDAEGGRGEAAAGPSLLSGASEATLLPAPGAPTWASLGRPDLRAPGVPRVASPGRLPFAADVDAARRLMADVLLPGDQALRTVTTPVEDVMLRRDWLPELNGTPDNALVRFAAHVVPTLKEPFEVWLTPYADGSYRKRYLALFDAVLVLVRENRDGSLLWQVYDQADLQRLNALRVGTLLFGRALR